jgi:hypothetical protein
MVLSPKQIYGIVKLQLRNADIFVTDADYITPKIDWITNTFYSNYEFWLRKNNMFKWKSYKDCDNFAFIMMVFASLCHAKTMEVFEKKGKKTYQGVTVGVIFYNIDGKKGKGHAINAVICGQQLLFFEPQSGKWVELTQEEKDSVWMFVM